jgi:hypothetical protein
MSHLEKCGKVGNIHDMKASAAALIKHVDSKGRLTLGEGFANETVLVETHADGEVTVRRARVIPARECWLYENKAALNSVRRGWKQASEQRFVASPDLATATELVGQLQDE